jgi:predicted dehydrogenase
MKKTPASASEREQPTGASNRAVLNAAIIGLGWWGRTIVDAVGNSTKLRLVKAMTRSAAGAAFARQHGMEISDDYAAILRDPHVDAVILCTPHSAHFDQVVQAAAAKKHVFCEKPLTLTRRETERTIQACNENRVVLGVGHERRFDPAIVEMRRRFDAGEFGLPLQIEANFHQDKFLELPSANWRLSSAEAPAGPLTATGIHMLDLAVSFFGPAERVVASVRGHDDLLANGDTLALLVTFKTGSNALISAILATPYDARFALYGSKGWAEMRDLTHPDAPTGSMLTVCRKGDERSSAQYPAVSAVRANLEAFSAAALGGAPYPPPQSEMIATVAALEAVIKSARTGRVETVEG